MTSLLFLFFCLVAGALLKKLPAITKEAPLVLNSLLLYVCLPAATLLHASSMQLSSAYGLPILMPWLLFGGSWLFFRGLRRFEAFERQTEAVLVLTAGIPSVSFVGFPLFELLHGEEGIKVGILMSQAGSFLVCSTLGIFLASSYANTEARRWAFVRDMFRFPPFLSFCVALGINLLGGELPDIVLELCRKLAAPFSFLALVSIGMQMEFQPKNSQWKPLLWGLFYKLFLAPLLIFVVFVVVLGKRGSIAELCVVGAALGPMNTMAIVAATYRLNPPLAAQMVGVGIPLSLLMTGIIVNVLHWSGYF